jgi:hypothetical protein
MKPKSLVQLIKQAAFLLPFSTTLYHSSTLRAARPVTNSRAWNLTATAFFSSTDPTNECVIRFVTVIADLGQQGQNAKSATVQSIVVDIFVFDVCNSTWISSSSGITTNGSVTIAPNLGSAKITATIPCIDDFQGVPLTANVDVTLTSIGQPSPFQGNYKDNSSPGTNVIVQATGIDRSAQAVGIVRIADYPSFGTGPSSNYVANCVNSTNLTPQLSFDGLLEKFNSATVTITSP